MDKHFYKKNLLSLSSLHPCKVNFFTETFCHLKMEFYLQVLPRRRWTRDVPLFHVNPNHCAMTFNEELHGIVGNHRVIRVFNQFSSNGRGNSHKDSLPTICRKFFMRDGLHPNDTGSQLLGALISQSVFKTLKEVNSPQRLPASRERRQEECASVVQSEEPAVSPVRLTQSKSELPQMIFRNSCVPPPPMEDPHHFPLLSPLVDGAENRSPCVLTGFSEAIKREVTISTPPTKQQPEIRHKRTCK